MIGRSLIIFQLGDNRNELHEVNPWEYALSHQDSDLKKKLIKERKKKKWKPEEVVSDAEVEAICNATNCLSEKEPGYHRWASDGVTIVNISGDPDLYNPLVPIQEREAAERKKLALGMEKLEEFLPELAKLRAAVPTGEVEVVVTLAPVTVVVNYEVWSPMSIIDVKQDGKMVDYASLLVSREALAKIPEVAALISCPFRKAYNDRRAEVCKLLELEDNDVSDAIYFHSLKKKSRRLKQKKPGLARLSPF